MSASDSENCTPYLKALADQTRWQIVQELFSGSFTVGELAERLEVSPYLSYNALSDGGEQRESHYAEFHEWLKDRYAERGKTNTFFR